MWKGKINIGLLIFIYIAITSCERTFIIKKDNVEITIKRGNYSCKYEIIGSEKLFYAYIYIPFTMESSQEQAIYKFIRAIGGSFKSYLEYKYNIWSYKPKFLKNITTWNDILEIPHPLKK